MNKILRTFAIVAVLFVTLDSHAQTAIRGVKNIVTTVPQGTAYQMNSADNVVNVDTNKGYVSDTTDIYLPATPYTTVYNGGGWNGTVWALFTTAP